MMTNTITKIVNSRYDLAKNAVIYAGRSIIILCAVYGALGTVISGFGFDIDLSHLFLMMLILSFTLTALATIFRKYGFLLGVVPFTFFIIRNVTSIGESFMYITHIITERYSAWLPIPILFQNAVNSSGITLFFISFGVLLILLLTITVCLRPSALLTILATLPIAFLSLVLTETVPDPVYLLILIVSYLTMILSHAVSFGDRPKSAIWLLPSLLVAASFSVIIFFASSPTQYVRSARMETIRYYVYNFAEQFSGYFNTDSGNSYISSGWFSTGRNNEWSFNTSRVDITDAGTHVIKDVELIKIEVSQSGVYYIRGYSLSNFSGSSWSTSEDPSFVPQPAVRSPNTYSDYYLSPFQLFDNYAYSLPANIAAEYLIRSQDYTTAELPLPEIAGMTIIRINDSTDATYRPYFYRYAAPFFGDAEFEFTEDTIGPGDYDILFFTVPGNIRDYLPEYVSYLLPDGAASYNNIYTQVDEVTKTAMTLLAAEAGINPASSREEISDAVAQYVKETAVYTLSPPAVPEDEDFAIYFLQTSQAGYCIHFATAAALMLRSLDVPARFVCGYVASVPEANSESFEVTLTDRNAHAWVEVFYDDAGWLPLEVTPSASVSEIPSPSPYSPVTELPSPTPSAPPPTRENEEAEPSEGVISQNEQGYISPNGTSAPSERFSFSKQSVNIFLTLCTVITSIIFIILRRRYINTSRNKHFMHKDTNRATISMWKYAVKLNRNSKYMPTDITELANKARFSQHTITEEERAYMLTYVRRLSSEVYDSKSDFGKFWFRYILCRS